MSNQIFSDSEEQILEELYEEFVEWLERINQLEEISADLSAFNLGLFETSDGYSAYITGANIYDAEDDDWRCEQDFVPKEKYFPFPRFFKSKHWSEILQLAINFVSRFMNSTNFETSFLSKVEAITVSFDDGDVHRVK
jgi:hypothetical protein